MNKTKKILIGVTVDGKGGVDSYINSFVKVANDASYKCDVLTSKFNKNYAEKLAQNNARLYEISTLHQKKNIYSKISELNQVNKYDASYWNISTAIMYPYVKAAINCGIKNNIVHSHAHYNSQPNFIKTKIFDFAHYYYRKKLSKENIKYAACAKECARWIGGNKIINEDKWLFVPNPIDTQKCTYNKTTRETLRNLYNLSNKHVVGCATAFMPYKNPLFLIQVFSELVKIDENAFLLVAGDGPMRNQVEQLANNLLPKNSYKLLGHSTNVPQLLQAFDVFVLPSQNEGLPLCILEAQAAGLPCIMSNTITDESIVCIDLVKKINLAEGAQMWAKEIYNILNMANKRSENYSEIVSNAGFNLSSPKIALSLFE